MHSKQELTRIQAYYSPAVLQAGLQYPSYVPYVRQTGSPPPAKQRLMEFTQVHHVHIDIAPKPLTIRYL
jgi:hypothetical protein